MVTPSSPTNESTKLLKKLIPISTLALVVALLSWLYLNNSIDPQESGSTSIKDMSALNGKHIPQLQLLLLQEDSSSYQRAGRSLLTQNHSLQEALGILLKETNDRILSRWLL